MSVINFDDVLSAVGDRGKYQTIMFIVLCIPATVPTAFLTFSNLFTTAVPDHWCRAPEELLKLGLNQTVLKYLTIPNDDGVYSKCTMYDTNSTNFYRDLISANGDIGNDRWKALFNISVLNENVSTTGCENGWEFDRRYYDKTLITEFNLVCDESWSQQTSTALFYVGSLFGNIIFGWISDKLWGRRTSMMSMIILEVIVSIVSCFPTNYKSYLIMRTVSGLFFPALYQIPFILGIEMMSPKHRPLAGMIICIMFASSMCLLSLLAYLLRDWFKLSIATSVPFILLYSYYWIIPESPRWLMSKGRISDANEVIQKMARFNGVKIPNEYLFVSSNRTETMNVERTISNVTNGDVRIVSETKSKLNTNVSLKLNSRSGLNQYDNVRFEKIKENVDTWTIQIKHDDDENDSETSHEEKTNLEYKSSITFYSNKRSIRSINEEATIIDIFSYANIRKKFLLLTYIWIANAVVYNGLSYNAPNLGVNDFLAFFIAAVIEIPSNIIAWKLMDIWGRKWLLCLTLGIGGIGCLACMFVGDDDVWITVSFAMIGKFGIAASFSVFYVFVGESFPTVIRSQAMGLSSFISSMGLLMFPYILELAKFSRVLPMVILGILSITGSLATLFLPDTLNVPMPQTLEDGENLGKNFKIFSLPKRTNRR